MKWIHIMDKQPEDGESIIHLDAPYDGHWPMGMRKYEQKCTWEEFMSWRKESDLPDPDFYWISVKDFPFPDREVK